MTPPETPAPDLDGLLSDFARDVGADGVTVWGAEAGCLVALANPFEPRIIGLRQPLGSGLISRCFHTGQAILEENLPAHPGHDPTIDRLLGRRCAAMMAAPFESADGGGVVSAVVYEGGRPGAGFNLAGLKQLGAFARNFAACARGPA